MRSMLEVQTARALDRIGVEWQYEPTRFADYGAIFTPDFWIESLRVKGWPGFDFTDVYLEARPAMDNAFQKKAERNAATLALSTDSPLLFVGLKEMPTALLGWCYGIRQEPEPVLGAIGRWSKIDLAGITRPPEPCLYVDVAAAIWADGFYTGRR